MQDTVGAIACTIDGDISAGVSRSGLPNFLNKTRLSWPNCSGGILLKRSGRVGEVCLKDITYFIWF